MCYNAKINGLSEYLISLSACDCSLFSFQIFMSSRFSQIIVNLRSISGVIILIRICCTCYHVQEQQQKQLELILAIATSGKLRESRQVRDQEQSTTIIRDSSEEDSKQKEAHQI